MANITQIEQSTLLRRARQSFDNQTDCEVCSNILSCAGQSVEVSEGYPLGLVEHLLQSQCPHVALFKDLLQKLLAGDPGCGRLPLVLYNDVSEPGFISFWLRRLPTAEFMMLHTHSDYMGLIHRLAVPNHPGTMRPVDPEWIDVGLVKEWITTCDAAHGVQCKQVPWLKHLEPIRPKYLIDTLEMCIVGGEQIEAEYIALSYQWGQTETLRNTIETRERLLAPYSLLNQEFATKIPRTISDAFASVELLGYRYLWVDALCIVSEESVPNVWRRVSDISQTQDDHVQLAAELCQMHRIYNSASFTIVAADGFDASYGLRGLKGRTAARKHPQVSMKLSGSEWMATRHPSTQYTERRGLTLYHTRAWTFQEFHFSLRRLVFANDAVEWHCEHGQMREDVIMELPKPGDQDFVRLSRRPTSNQWFRTAMPTPSSMIDLVDAYNVLNLSYPEDAFPAFAGVQSLLERLYQPGFLYGLPEFWFDIALCWTPTTVSRRVRRHEAASSTRPAENSSQLPSWSWIGWAGSVRFPTDDVLGNGFTEPVTKWYTLADPTSPERRPISSEWYQYRSQTVDSRLDILSKGWTQHTDEEGRIVFSHTRRPYANYLYPFPVPEPSSTFTSTSVSQTAYLFARTTRTFLLGKQVHVKSNGLCAHHPLWLASPQGRYVGFLHLNNEEEQSYFEHAGSDSLSLNPLELVAISRGTSRLLLTSEIDWNIETEVEKIEYYEGTEKGQAVDCIFVLWIEWQDGVAYRRACGVVTAEAWEQEREEELVDLILG
jgi:hypothetical protein